MTEELFVVIFRLTIISLALIVFNFIVLFSLKERQGFKEVPMFIKVIILFPPLGLVYYFVVEMMNFFNDYFKKQKEDDDLPF